MTRRKLAIGQVFGRLTVFGQAQTDNPNHPRWKCRCNCGTFVTVAQSNLGKKTFSCGCLMRERRGASQRTHGMTHSVEYATWCRIKTRCYNTKHPDYPAYGGRGIRVCARWINSFENFLADMGERPSPSHSIDRFPNNDGDYAPDNCRWATPKQQAANRRQQSSYVHWKHRSAVPA